MDPCVFCRRIAAQDVSHANDHAVAFPDAFPVAEGHTLVVPRRHEADLFELPNAERAATWALVDEIHAELDHRLTPDGFNVGVNSSPAAGQTVAHAHVHVIPRWVGDVDDPRGGVRWVIPHKADYWTKE